MHRTNRIFSKASGSVMIALLAASATVGHAAAPQVGGALLTGEKIGQTQVLKIKGSNFSQRTEASPILIDSVDSTMEKGISRSYFAGQPDGYLLQEAGEKNLSPWADVAYGDQNKNVTVEKPVMPRHEQAGRAYRLKGENAWFGKPKAYGGTDGWAGLPVDEPQLYVSYWFHTNYDPTNYWRFGFSSSDGRFSPGEKVRIFAPDSSSLGLDLGSLLSLQIGQFETGTFIGYDSSGMANVELDRRVSANDVKGGRMVGMDSRASAIVPETPAYGKAEGYDLPGTKLMRVWDEPTGTSGIRSSVAVHDFYVGSPVSSSLGSGMVYDSVDLSSAKWHHIEYEIDMERGFARAYIDGRLRGQANFDPSAGHTGQYSPTLALMGINGKVTPLLNSYIDDIYIDNSLQRVVVGNAARLEDVTVAEVQPIRSWNSTEIEIGYESRSLDPKSPKYVYVYNRQGEVNSEGYPLCGDGICGSPPEPVKIFIK